MEILGRIDHESFGIRDIVFMPLQGVYFIAASDVNALSR
jgi:hypothetical protein